MKHLCHLQQVSQLAAQLTTGSKVAEPSCVIFAFLPFLTVALFFVVDG